MKIKQAIPHTIAGHLFRYIDVVTDNTGMGLSETQAVVWYFNKSANKEINDILEILNPYNETGVFTDSDLDKLSNLLNDVYGDDWKREYEALTAEYNPIENYDRSEDMTLTDTMAQRQVTGSAAEDSHSNKRSATTTPTLKETDRVIDNIGQRVTTEAAHTDTHRNAGRIHGNVGVTTNQQMITSEVEMRKKYHMMDLICRDIDSFITIKHYTI